MLDALYSILQEEDFQDPTSGLMSFPAYLYAYPPEREYAFRDALPAFCDRLRRPPVEQDPLVIDVYTYLIERLKEQRLGARMLLEIVLDEEERAKEKTDRLIRDQLDRDDFYGLLGARIQAWRAQDDGYRHSYVFVHGWGRIYPYLRSSTFMTRMESHVQGYKLILLYPGTWERGKLYFLGSVESQGPYRASCLNEKLAPESLS